MKGTFKKNLKCRVDPSHARKEGQQINNVDIKQLIFNFSQLKMYSFLCLKNKKEINATSCSKRRCLFQSRSTSDKIVVYAMIVLMDLR